MIVYAMPKRKEETATFSQKRPNFWRPHAIGNALHIHLSARRIVHQLSPEYAAGNHGQQRNGYQNKKSLFKNDKSFGTDFPQGSHTSIETHKQNEDRR